MIANLYESFKELLYHKELSNQINHSSYSPIQQSYNINTQKNIFFYKLAVPSDQIYPHRYIN